MANKIQFKRGLKANLPALSVGEPAFTTDSKDLYVGSATGNIQFAKYSALGDLNALPTTDKTSAVAAMSEMYTTLADTMDTQYQELLDADDTKVVKDAIVVNVKDHGAIGNGVADDTAAIQALLNVGGVIYLPVGTYKITSPLIIKISGTRLIGIGSYSMLDLPSISISSTILSNTGAAQPSLIISDGLQHIDISNISVKRNVAASNGNTGVYFNNCNLCSIKNVEISGHYIGLILKSTGFSTADDLYVHDNYSYGIYMENSSNSGALQWQLARVLSQCNGDWGVSVNAITNSVGFVTMGTMSGLNTYANTNGGIRFIGLSTTPINGIRIENSFFGEDGGDEIYLDTYGTGSHKLSSIFIEAAGTSPTGVGQGTAASHTGGGIKATVNTYGVDVCNCIVINNSYNGIESRAAQLLINGCDIRLNGNAGIGGTQIGIMVTQGQATITGNKSMGQQYGIYLSTDESHIIVGNRLSQNTVTGFAAGVTLTTTIEIGNIKT